MAQQRTLLLACALVAVVSVLSLSFPVYAASCEAIIGRWTWFTGGVVTMKPDGTMVHELGNDGTWTCTDPTRGVATLRWRLGGYVNTLVVSPDGRGLSSTDPSQSFVTAKRIGEPSSPPVQKAEGDAKAHLDRERAQKVTPEDSQEIARLVDRISNNYKDTLLFDADSEGEYIQKGVGIELSRDYGEKATLQQNFHICDLAGVKDSQNYKASIDSVGDCDKSRQGLMWEENIFQTAPLTQIEPSSIKISRLDKSSSWSALNYVKHEGLHVTFDFAGYKAKSGTITGIVCKSYDACQQVAADLKRLVEIARKSTAANPTSSLQSGPAQADFSHEISQLVARLTQNYHRDTLEFRWSRDDFFNDGYIRKGHTLTLEHDFMLVERYLECDISDSNWPSNWGLSEDALPPPYHMSVDSVTDCDKQRSGLKWEEKTERRPLAEIDPSTVELSTRDGWGNETDPYISFDYDEAHRDGMTDLEKKYVITIDRINCKDRNACEQMAADLKRLVEIARKSAAPGKTPSR